MAAPNLEMFDQALSQQNQTQNNSQSSGGGQPPSLDMFDQALAQQKGSGQNDNGGFMAFVENMNRQFATLPEGVLGLLGDITGSTKLQEAVKHVHDTNEASAALAAEQHPTAAAWGKGAGFVGSTLEQGLLIPGGTSGNLAKRIFTTALGAGGASYLDYAPDQQTRIEKGITGAIVGGGIYAGIRTGKWMYDILKGGKHSGFAGKLLSPTKAAEKDITADILHTPDQYNTIQATQKAAEDIGLPGTLSPGDSGGVLARTQEMGIRSTGDVKMSQYDYAIPKQEKLQQLQKQLIDDMSPEGTVKVRDNAYEMLKGKPIGDAEYQGLMSDPTIQKFTGDSQYVPNDAYKLNQIRQGINSEIYARTFNVTDPKMLLRGAEKDNTLAAVSKIDQALENSPVGDTYRIANKSAQRVMIQEQFTDMLGKVKDSTNPINGIYNKFFNAPEKRQLFLAAVRKTAPSDVEGEANATMAQKVIQVMQAFKDSPHIKALSKRTAEESNPASGISIWQRMDNLSDKVYQQKLLDLILNGGWKESTIEVLNKGSQQSKLKALYNVLTSVTTRGKAPAAIFAQGAGVAAGRTVFNRKNNNNQ